MLSLTRQINQTDRKKNKKRTKINNLKGSQQYKRNCYYRNCKLYIYK